MSENNEENTTVTGPRVRWAAIVWGAFVSLVAVGILFVGGSTTRRAAFADWLGGLDGGQVWLVVVVVAGAILLVSGLLAVLRRASTDRLTRL